MQTFIRNKQGAKIYMDISKHKYLEIPKTYEVLAVGFQKQIQGLVTVRELGKAVAYRLPEDLNQWAFDTVAVARLTGNPFPCKVEFGTHENGRHYAEML